MCRILGLHRATRRAATGCSTGRRTVSSGRRGRRAARPTATINADGWGVGWYDRSVRPEPARYRTTTPMWADRNFPVDGAVDWSSDCVVAAVRDASPGMPVDESSTAPFSRRAVAVRPQRPRRGLPLGRGHRAAPIADAPARGRHPRRQRQRGASSPCCSTASTRARPSSTPSATCVAEVRADRRGPTQPRAERRSLDRGDVRRRLARSSGPTTARRDRITLVASEPIDDDDDWIDVPDDTVVIAVPRPVPDLQPL